MDVVGVQCYCLQCRDSGHLLFDRSCAGGCVGPRRQRLSKRTRIEVTWLASQILPEGRTNCRVNNLGGSRNAKIWEMAVGDFDFVLRLNLRSTFLVTRAAAPHMMKRRQGRIICLSSGAREGTPWTAYYQGGAAYSMAKAGVHGFIRDVALELAEYNITVNAVAPGPIDTERTGPGLRRLDATVERSPSKMTPLGRLGTADEVAAAALFLASDEASYISGHTLAVAGGR
jgi:NAD(P)-dependent dehydrogenase (short-subunit alcohol dehydrogenase family)